MGVLIRTRRNPAFSESLSGLDKRGQSQGLKSSWLEAMAKVTHQLSESTPCMWLIPHEEIKMAGRPVALKSLQWREITYLLDTL